MDEVIRYAGAADLRRWYASRELSPVEFLRATLDLLADNVRLNAFVTVAAEVAMAQAEAAERRIRTLGTDAWDGQPLLGVPVSVKDLTPTAGIRTTRGSLRYADWTPDRDAPAVRRLREAGSVIFGKTNTSEFGWSAGTVNRLMPPTANPWDLSRSAGGSSGGAAAAVAAGIGVAATGTDGAGSVRIPAAFCGVVGLKPTFGHIPYVPLSPEGLSHLGVLARDVDTTALLAAVMAGPDPEDPLSAPRPVDPRDPPRPVRIGWLGRDDPSEVDRTVHAATRVLAGLGHHIEEIDVPFADPYPHLVTIVATAEAAAESAEQPAGQSGERPIFDGLADPARLRVAAHGRRLSAMDLMRAQTERLLLIRCLDRVMERFDLLAMPTVSIEPFPVHAWRPDPTTGDEMDWLAWCRSTYPFNLTGQPAICLPAGFTVAGQPVGLQLVGRRGEDSLLLDVSGQFERASPWRWSYPEKDR